MNGVTPVEERLASLEQRLGLLTDDLRRLRRLATDIDVASALNKARSVTEKVALALCERHKVTWGSAEPTLERIVGPLVAAEAIPKDIAAHVRTIQLYGNMGSHANTVSEAHLTLALVALVEFLEWFHSLNEGAGTGPAAAPATRVEPLIVHPLAPARDFAGRQEELARLRAFLGGSAPQDAERVLAVVGLGGMGKSALVERALSELLASGGPQRVVVWSFYEDRRVEALLGAALGYVAGVEEPRAGALLDRLKQELARATRPTVLVLDGIETVQSPGGAGRAVRGRLEDAALRLLLTSIAAGVGRTRALVTSRLPLADLEPWAGRGYALLQLSDLDAVSSLAVLSAWGVHGEDAALQRIHRLVGGHALSLVAIASYLQSFQGGAASAADMLALESVADEEVLAARLTRILDGYASALGDDERDVLAWASAFPRGATFDLLGALASAPAEVAGAIAGMNTAALRTAVERLKKRGLVSVTRAGQREIIASHPFVRQHFRRLLGDERARGVHGVAREQVRVSLAQAPAVRIVTSPELLDIYEALIEHTTLAGEAAAGTDIYRAVLGGYNHLGLVLGENARGQRITATLLAAVEAGAAVPGAEVLYNHAGLFAQALGDTAEAKRFYQAALAIKPAFTGARENLADLLRVTGDLVGAKAVIEGHPRRERGGLLVTELLVAVLSAQGDPGVDALIKEDPGLDSYALILRGTTLLERGDVEGAERWLARADQEASQAGFALDAARARLGRARCAVARGAELDAAARMAEEALAWALRAGHVELIADAQCTAAEVARASGDGERAGDMAQAAAVAAEGAGYVWIARRAARLIAVAR
jgi:tetratricopeptide (TPR) repeat protein